MNTKETPKQLMLGAFGAHDRDPENMTCNYMPEAIAGVLVEMQTTDFAHLPDGLESFFCHDQELIFDFDRFRDPPITVESTRRKPH